MTLLAPLLGLLAVGLAATACSRGAEPAPAAPAEPEAAATGFLFESVTVDGRRMLGAIYRPRDMGPGEMRPAILFLHGSGECGADGVRQLAVGLPPAVVAAPQRWPYVIVVPQKRDRLAEWEDHEAEVLALLDLAAERYGADPERVAITGLSQGGHGAIALATRHPERFVAAAPVCAYVERWHQDGMQRRVPATEQSAALAAAADGLAEMPVWIFHGERDDVVSPAESRLLHAALERRGANAQLTVFPDASHNAWDPAYRRSTLHEWMAEHLRAE